MRIEKGTRALVTGATSGIGLATARALAGFGARVGLVARSESQLAEVAEPLEGAVALPADVSDREAIESAIETFVADAGGLDLLVANAGVAHTAPFADLDADKADQMVAVNLTGTINTVRAGMQPMLDSARGHIVVVSSAAAYRAFPWTAVYGATKAGQRAFAEALRHELSGTGVSLTTVYPGEVETALHAHERDRVPDWLDPDEAVSPESVAVAIIDAVQSDERELHVPPRVRLLGLNSLAPGLTDRLLVMLRGGSAAPRR